MKLNPYLTSYTKINSEIDHGTKTIKLLEENIGVNLHDLGLGNGFS